MEKNELLALLLSGTDTWNQWRRDNREAAIDLRGVNLHGADLSGVNLSRVDLGEANLSQADLFGVDLSGANLERANLERANLFGVNLSGANLEWANLSWSTLAEANLSEANLRMASLRGVSFNGAILHDADLRFADFFKSELSGARLRGAKFSVDAFYKASFGEVNLNDADSFRLFMSYRQSPPRRGYKGSELYKRIQKDLSTLVFTDTPLTPNFLLISLAPFLQAIADTQQLINELQGNSDKQILIKDIVHYSPITVTMEGVIKAIQEIRDIIIPWRRKHQKQMLRFEEQEKKADIEHKKVGVLEKKALVKKTEAEANKINAEAERILLEAKVELALRMIASIAPNLSDEEKLTNAKKLLPALEVLVSSDLDFTERR